MIVKNAINKLGGVETAKFVVQRGALILGALAGSCSTMAFADEDAGTVFDNAVRSSGGSTLLERGMKVFGGFLVIGGIALGINGFTGREEGYEKALKIGIGVLTLALGAYFLSNGAGAFSLNKMLA